MILVVDDQEKMCWILSLVLSEAGFSVKTARTAKEALSIVDESEISAAIIDYSLPDRNGFRLFLDLKKRKRNLPCVLITAYGLGGLREITYQLGFSAYFDKPFSNHTLIAALKKILGIE